MTIYGQRRVFLFSAYLAAADRDIAPRAVGGFEIADDNAVADDAV
jgi:hypothetical protein